MGFSLLNKAFTIFLLTSSYARRLYQFKDELPAKVAVDIPDGYSGPKVKFSGNGIADIFTNVYYHNWHDMATCKVDEDGMAHTSSSWAPNFGIYVGFGTYKNDFISYSKHMWARDIGRVLVELVKSGEKERTAKAGDMVHRYLYDGCIKYKQPHWKRIINGSSFEELNKFLAGKENDGHAAIMNFVHSLASQGIVDEKWLKENSKQLHDAVDWIGWQIQNPKESNFDRVLYSESEVSTQQRGGYDLFSNICVYYSMKEYEEIGKQIQDTLLESKCAEYSEILKAGIMERFISIHPRYGKIFVDTLDDVFTYEYKRFGALFLMPDFYTYDLAVFDAKMYEILQNTYLAQKEEFFSYAAGRQMGYGQGYLTQTCILLDQYDDFTGCVEQAAMFSYHHTDYKYTVPEGVINHPSGRFWFRNADLGNAVQQGEIIKCARLLIGLDDNMPQTGLNIITRLPNGWDSIDVSDYTVIGLSEDNTERVAVSLKYKRKEKGYELDFKAEKGIKLNTIRFGPFDKNAQEFKIDASLPYQVIERGGRVFVYVKVGEEIKELKLCVEI